METVRQLLSFRTELMIVNAEFALAEDVPSGLSYSSSGNSPPRKRPRQSTIHPDSESQVSAARQSLLAKNAEGEVSYTYFLPSFVDSQDKT